MRFSLLFLLLGLLLSAIGCSRPAATPSKVVEESEPEPTAADWVGQLRTGTMREQSEAVDVILKFSPEMKADAVESLIEALKDDRVNKPPIPAGRYGSVREAAVTTLLQLGPKAEAELAGAGVRHLAEGLQSADPLVRERTALALAKLGDKVEPAAKALADQARAPENEVRQAALLALRPLGGKAAPLLLPHLTDQDDAVRSDTAEALEWMKPLPTLALPLLAEAMQVANERLKAAGREAKREASRRVNMYVRRQVASALATAPKSGIEALPSLLAALEDLETVEAPPGQGPADGQPLKVIDKTIHKAIRAIGPAAVPSLIGLLSKPDPGTRLQAVILLASVGKASKEAEAALVKMLDDDAPRVQIEAAGALLRLGSSPERPLTMLSNLLKHENPEARALALELLFKAGKPALGTVPAAAKLLSDPDPMVRLMALRFVAGAGPVARDYAKQFAELLDNPAKGVDVAELSSLSQQALPILRVEAATLLGRLGADGAVGVPALVAGLRADEADVRKASADALRRLGPAAAPAVADLVAAVQRTDDIVDDRLVALDAIGAIGPEAKAALPAVIAALKDGNPRLRAAAAHVVARIGPSAADKAVPLLGKMLTSDLSGEARIAAVRALAALGPAAKPALNALETAQTSKTADIRLWAVVAQARATNELGAAVSTLTDEIQAKKALSPVKAAAVLAMANLAADNPKALQVVIDAAADPSPFLRLAAAEGLASLGTQEAAITTLILLTRDKDDRVRQAAIVALGQIGPPAEAAAGRLRDLIARMDDLAAFAQAALERIAPERP